MKKIANGPVLLVGVSALAVGILAPLGAVADPSGWDVSNVTEARDFFTPKYTQRETMRNRYSKMCGNPLAPPEEVC